METLDNTVGIDEILDVAECYVEIVDDIHEQKMDDGKLTMSEIGQVAAENALGIFEAFWGADEIPEQVKNMTDAQKAIVLDKILPATIKLIKTFA